MSLWRFVDVWLARIIKWPVFISATCIGCMMLLAVTDIVTSKFFSLPIPGTAEIIEEANVFVICMAIAYVQLSRGHISVNVFAKYLSPRANHALKLAGYILGMLASGLVCWRAIVLTQTMIELSSTKAGLVKFILWPFPFAIVVGFGLLVLAFIVTFIKGIATGPEVQPGHDS